MLEFQYYKHWDFPEDPQARSIDDWHNYQRDARFYGNAVEVGASGCSVVWSLALPIPPGAIFDKQGTHSRDPQTGSYSMAAQDTLEKPIEELEYVVIRLAAIPATGCSSLAASLPEPQHCSATISARFLTFPQKFVPQLVPSRESVRPAEFQ